jgi:hypothetical protein
MNYIYKLWLGVLEFCKILEAIKKPSCENSDIEVSMLASGTQDRGFKTGRRRRIFFGRKKSKASLPSEGK